MKTASVSPTSLHATHADSPDTPDNKYHHYYDNRHMDLHSQVWVDSWWKPQGSEYCHQTAASFPSGVSSLIEKSEVQWVTSVLWNAFTGLTLVVRQQTGHPAINNLLQLYSNVFYCGGSAQPAVTPDMKPIKEQLNVSVTTTIFTWLGDK